MTTATHFKVETFKSGRRLCVYYYAQALMAFFYVALNCFYASEEATCL